MGGNSTERVVVGDMYRYRNDTSKLRRVQFVEGFLVECVFRERGGFLTRRLRGGWCAQSTDSPALVVL